MFETQVGFLKFAITRFPDWQDVNVFAFKTYCFKLLIIVTFCKGPLKIGFPTLGCVDSINVLLGSHLPHRWHDYLITYLYGWGKWSSSCTWTANTSVQAAPSEANLRPVSRPGSSSFFATMKLKTPKAISDTIDKMLDTKYMARRRYLEKCHNVVN